MVILNGRCGSDKDVGKFTFHNYRGQSVIDYVLVSRDLYDNIQSFEVCDPNILSDHSVVSFSLKYIIDTCITQSIEEPDNYDYVGYKYVWNAEKSTEYVACLGSPEVTGYLDNLLTELESSDVTESLIDNNLDRFVNVLESCSQPLFQCNCSSFVTDKPDYCENELPWYNNDCRDTKREFYICLDVF